MYRSPTSVERDLLEKLVDSTSNLELEPDWMESLLVEPMSDGRMGSLELIPPNASPYRKFGGTVSTLEFTDADGVIVSVTLNVDQSGQLFELDIWKSDFSPLIRFPDTYEHK
jgi:hypothetical protein